MLGYLILAAVQLALAFYGAPQLLNFLKLGSIGGGTVQNFITATVAAVIVWIVGVVGSLVLQDVKMPASATLASTLIGALIGAAIVSIPAIREVIPNFGAPDAFFWCAGAVIGYMVRR